MSHAAAAARSRRVVAVLAVALFLACLHPAASSSSRRAEAASLQRVEMAAMYAPQDLQEKPDVTKDAEEDVSTTGFGAEEEREVPTGPDPIHHHARGPRRRQSP
ncbi:protein CLAVATA 3-like [Lolium rigidum]|uniref:protein CLAVATA 3-like n=1 Tax=Lolium rigidum TaxID=89674 RepID=UPI001F5C4CA4|nr:protein CLAVATA 3-like [Lolium rigidum]